MAELLFKLNGVPEDEAHEVRELLSEQRIDFYETSAGNWGVSLAAIWLKDAAQLQDAQRLLEDYQQQRVTRARDDQQATDVETFSSRWKSRPLQLLAILILIAIILYISISPFMNAWT